MYSQHFQQGMDQPGMVTNPGRGQLNRDFFFNLFLFAPENLVSRDRFGRPVPRQPVHSPHSAGSVAHSRDSSRFSRRPHIP